jgi:hypothetical protein
VGRRDEGIGLMKESLQRARKPSGEVPAVLWRVPLQLADAFSRAGRFAKAEPILRASLEQARHQFGPSNPVGAQVMAKLGLNLLQQRKWAEAEPVLRECLAIRQETEPDDWSTFNTRSSLGGALLGQGKFAEAEPLILSGYEGMKAREGKIPPQGRPRLSEAASRVVELYEAWDRPDKAAGWRARLGLAELPAEVFAP